MIKQLRIWLFVLLGSLLTSTTLPAEGVITMTTSKALGEKIGLAIKANGSVTIIGVQEAAQTDGYSKYYTLTSQTITIRGDVTLLYCSYSQLTSLDLSKNTALTTLECRDNQLTSLDVSSCTALTTLSCGGNQLTSLNLSGCTALTMLNCSRTNEIQGFLTSLDVSGCTALTELNCYGNQLTSLDVSGCTALTTLDCKLNPLTRVNLSNCKSLKEFSFSGAFLDQLTNLDISGCIAMTSLNCENNQLTSLDVSGCTALTKLDCSYNQLTSLDVSKNTALTTLDCYRNQLTSLDVSKNTALTALYCRGNQLTNLDVSKNTALTSLGCGSNLLRQLNVLGCTNLSVLYCQDNQLRQLNVAGCTNLSSLDCSMNQIKGAEMANLVNSLPDRQGAEEGFFYVFDEVKYGDVDGNVCLAAHVATAKEKNWRTQFYRKDKYYDYTGLDNPTFTVTYSSSNGGSISITGADDLQNVPYDTELTVVTNVADGYKLTTLTANGQDILQTKCFKVTANTEVRAVFTLQELELYYSVTPIKLGKGTIQVTGADDLNSVAPGTELTITATPAEGYELIKLTANDRNILDTKTVIVNEDLIIRAVFKEKTYKVSLDRSGEGTLYVSGADDLDAVTPGTELTVTATPAEGYELTELTANGQSILDTKKVVVNEDLIIKAIFSKKTFKVSLEKHGKGTIRAIGADNLDAVPYGTELTIEATPAEGSELTALVAGGINITETKKVTIKKETTIEAFFTTQSFAVELAKEGEGTISAMGADDLDAVAYGTELTINATPAAGYELTALTANGTDILASQKVTIKEAVDVKATFTKKNFVVTLEKAGEGDLSTTGIGNLKKVPYGTELTIIATPAEGYELQSLVAGGVDITATKKIVVKDNLTVKATFSKKSFAVTFAKEGEGTISATGASSLNAVAYGTELTINATPAEGYELTALTANGTDILATKKIVVKDNMTVKATFTKKNFAISLTKEGEGTITATGASNLNSVAYGTELTINATPAMGYELVSITAGGTDITASKKVVVTGNLTVKATFAKKAFAVSLTKEGEGTISATGADDLNAVAYGTELTINATPAMGYELQSLVAGGVDITATKKIVVKDNLTVKATFAKKSFAVTFDKVGEGMITATGADDLNAVAYGTELTIVATPAEGYELTALTANGTDILATKKIVVEGNLTVKGTFTKKSFAVSLTKEGEGTITATGASNLNSVAYGTELTINATPAMGYELVSITAGGTDITASKKVVVTGNLAVKATFAKKSFAVTFNKVGEGTITATGASNLNSVAYGTELTIVATPAEGYELTALTANGTDILATKKVVVEGNLTVKATFEKKTFAVTLTSNEHGDITIVEPVNLDAVPYGTTLTVKATGKNAQCVLTELTANGKNILATKSFVVTDVTEVKATFVDHTGVETTVTQQVKLYPNPATDYVIVEGVAPASEVTLHSMTGERLYAGRADDRGTLQIDLTPYADGVYLVCVAGETYRVVVRH